MLNYRITLEVLTPVYIGNGSQITKKDFSLEGGCAHIYDPIKLYLLFGKDYEEFLMNNFTLTDFLIRQSHRKNLNLKSALRYSVLLGDNSIRKSDGINEFIKDPYGMAYVPGSSLKGAIRTAILGNVISEKRGEYSGFSRERIDQFGSTNKIEENAFGEFQKSIFKNIRISDSKPIDNSNLILSKKIDIFKDGNSNNKLNLCKESLKPGTKIEFSLTIDDFEKGKYFEPEYIMKSINFFTDQYRAKYLKKFNSYKDEYGKDVLYLGGGTGFLTKTINQSLYGEDTLEKVSRFLEVKFKNHKHYKDRSIGISPRAKKCTVINRETMEMGICRIRID